MRIEYSARSHLGLVRGNNEDNLYVDGVFLTPEIREYPFTIDGMAGCPALFAVCDGIGGEENGEDASLTAVQMLGAADALIKNKDAQGLDQAVQSLVEGIHEAIRAGSQSNQSRTGTTLALAVVTKSGIHCFNLGDSRIYALHQGNFQQITRDHTPDGESGYQLTRCLGIGESAQAEAYPPLPPNSRLLICTDGLTDRLDSAEIEAILRTPHGMVNAADYLLNSALIKGGEDNVTLILVDLPDSRSSFAPGPDNRLQGQDGL